MKQCSVTLLNCYVESSCQYQNNGCFILLTFSFSPSLTSLIYQDPHSCKILCCFHGKSKFCSSLLQLNRICIFFRFVAFAPKDSLCSQSRHCSMLLERDQRYLLNTRSTCVPVGFKDGMVSGIVSYHVRLLSPILKKKGWKTSKRGQIHDIKISATAKK